MKPIPAKIVEDTWQKMSMMSTDKVFPIIDQMSQEQPWILGYLMGIGEDVFNQDERELLFYIGIVIWKMMMQGDRPLRQVTDENLDNAEEANFRLLEKMAEESPGDFIAVTEEFFESYNQKEVLRYIVEAIMEEDIEEEIDIRDESKGWMLIYLKTVLDCLDAD